MAGYTRQSTFADGDTITAALFNNEYNQLVNAFSNTSGHAHDGTAANGPVIGLIGDAGETSPNNKVVIDTTNNYIEFYVEVSSSPVQQLYIADGAIIPVTDNDIDLGTSSLEFKDLYLDGTATIDTLTVDEAATIGTTLGVTGATTLSSTLGVTGATTLSSTLGVTGAATLSSTLAVTGTSTLTGNVTASNDLSVGGNLTVTGNATISGNLTFGDADTDSITLTADVASNIVPDIDDTYDLGTSTKQWRNLYIDGTAEVDTLSINGTAVTSTAAELNILDGVTATAAEINTLDGITATVAELNILDGVTSTATELNIMDGDTAATATTLADADRVVVNDAGVMKQVALTDFETYFEGALDTLSNVTTVGALNAGSITSGFGAIDNGSSNITTTGTVTYGSLSDGVITITAFADEDDMTSNSATLVPTQQSVKAYVDAQVTAQDLDFQGDSGGALSIDLDSESLTIAGGTGIDTSGATNTLTVAIDSTVATLTGSQTLTNKTLTTPVISSISNTGTLTLPTSTDTLVGRATTDTLTNKTLDADNNTLSNIEVDNFKASAIVLESEGIGSNDNDTTLPTSAAVKDYVDTQITAEDLDVSDGTASIAIDLDSETLGILGGTGLTSSASGNNVTLSVDAAQTQITSVGTLSDLTVTGEITANGGIALGDSDKATFGASDDLEIYHDGSNSYVQDGGTGNLVLKGTEVVIQAGANGESKAIFRDNGASELYYDDSLKLATTTSGIDVTGTAVVDGLTVDGAVSGTAFLDDDTFATATATTLASSESIKAYVDSSVGGVSSNSISDADGDTKIQVEESADEDIIRFDTAGTERMVINATGNVGIGTTSPSTNVAVGTSALETIGYGIDWTGAGAGQVAGFTANTSTGEVRIGATNAAGTYFPTFYSNGSEVMRLDSSGNLLLGSSSNTSRGGSATKQLIKLASGQSFGLDIQASSTSAAGNIIFSDGSSGSYGQVGYNHASDILDFYTASSERMRIDSSGNVGIGVTSVNQKLEVGDATAPKVRFNRVGSYYWDIGHTNSDFQFESQTGGVIMHMNFDGNIGMGTDSPATDLAIVKSTSPVLRLERSGASQLDITASTAAAGSIIDAQSNHLVVRTSTAEYIAFETNDTERMRIDSSGDVLINTTAAFSGGVFDVQGGTNNTIEAMGVKNNSSGSFNVMMKFYTSAGAVGRIDWDNTGSAMGFTNLSDARLKNVTGEAKGLELINKLNPVKYYFKDNDWESEGLIAQEVEQTFEELDMPVKGVRKPDEDNEHYMLDYSVFTTNLIKAVKELSAEVDELKNEIKLLKGGN